MNGVPWNSIGRTGMATSAAVLILAIGLRAPDAVADEAEAKSMLKAMSDYLAQQKTLSFSHDTNLEVVTKDHQKLLLASSGKADLSQPDDRRVGCHIVVSVSRS
jgi:hypothetical protein